MRTYLSGPVDLSIKNLRRRSFRNICLIALLALLSFALIAGAMLSYGLLNGLHSVSARLGADFLIVPDGYEQKTEGALLQGDPSTFYLDTAAADRILQSSDFSKASPQLYIATLSAACCSAPVQLIGFDPNTDFVIAPWLSAQSTKKLGLKDVVVGANISADAGGELQFFSTTYHVVAKLQQTGMGFDNSVFMNMETAQAAIKDYNQFTPTKLPDKAKLVSVITADTPGGYSLAEQQYLNMKYANERIQFIAPQNLISGLSQNLNLFLTFSVILLVILWIISVSALLIVFFVTLNERKREFAIYRALGSSRKWLTRAILTETFLVSTVGAAAGAVIFCVLAFSFKALVLQKITLPYVTPGALVSAAFIVGGFLVSLAASLLAAAVSSARIGSVADKALRPGGF
jgi:ABC-type antimicrobial peptide transport system, permease component